MQKTAKRKLKPASVLQEAVAFLLVKKKVYIFSCATPKKDFSMESALKIWPNTSPSPPWQVLDSPSPVFFPLCSGCQLLTSTPNPLLWEEN